MTISSTNRKAGPYLGNGSSTVFPFSFKIFSASDLYVTRTNPWGVATTLTKDVDFIPTLNANQDASPGGSIALTAALAVGYTLDITSDISPTQLVDLTNQGGFYPQVITKALDKITILIQQLITNGITSGSIGGIVTSARNLVGGFGLFFGKVGDELQFKSLVPGTNVSIVDTGNTLRISATGGGGGTWDGFANIVDFGAVADFVPAAGGLGTGTSNDTAVMAAIATNKPLYIPAGNFYVANWATRYAFSRASVLASSAGHIWGDTSRGKQILGNTLSVGVANTHEIDYAGGIKWAAGPTFNGTRTWLGHHNWMITQPDNGPMQAQLYPGYGGKGHFGTTAHCVSPDKLVADLAPFDTTQIRPGNHVGWAGAVYKVASVIDGTTITVTKFDGSSPAFVTNTTPKAFYMSYECAMFTANVSGTTVTRISGDALPYGFGGDHMYAIINGTRYSVAQGPESTGNPSTITLTTSPGTLTNASVEFYRIYGPWAYVTLFRLQGLGGGVETNGGMAFTIKNQLRVFNGGDPNDPLTGDVKVNGKRVILGQSDGGSDDELVEVGGNYVTLGGRPGQTNRNWFEMDSLGVAIAPILKAEGPGTNIPMVLSGKGTGNIQLGLGTNNLLAVQSATTFAPALASRGNDTNPDMGFDLQGSGTFRFTAGTFGRTVAEIYAPSGSTSWPTMSAINGTYAAFGVAGAAANIDVRVVPKGTAGRALIYGVPSVSLTRDGAMTFANNSGTTISWDTELSDLKGMHAGTSSVITAPVAGIYSISTGFQISATSDANGVIITGIYIIKNGSALRAAPFHRHRGPNSGVYVCGSNYTTQVVLAAGDTIEIQGYYDGASATASLDTSFTFTTFDMHLVTAL